PFTKVFGVSDPFFKKGLSLRGERAYAASVPGRRGCLPAMRQVNFAKFIEIAGKRGYNTG
ncbi:MAG: hypothetical protein IKD18_01850, partial [Clostridia bacterium]|nr:hypothetical protein [Clostridia bacterium]